MAKWKDKRRGDETIESTLVVGPFKLSVHRHIDRPKDVWLASCYGLMNNIKLAHPNLQTCKTEAQFRLQGILSRAADEIADV
jgi:hypothetical protein